MIIDDPEPAYDGTLVHLACVAPLIRYGALIPLCNATLLQAVILRPTRRTAVTCLACLALATGLAQEGTTVTEYIETSLDIERWREV